MEQEAIETFKHAGLTVEIHQDDSHQDTPDDYCDDELFLVHYHRDFDVRRDKIITEEACTRKFGGEKIEQDKKYHFFLTKTYIHSGVVLGLEESGVMFPDERWDVSRCGFILVSKKLHRLKKSAYKSAKTLVKDWNYHLAGEIYGYVVKDTDDEHLDSCWGFVGEIDYCKEEGMLAADSIAKDLHDKRLKLAKALIKNKVPLEKRQQKLAS